jgi:hypothetical protein
LNRLSINKNSPIVYVHGVKSIPSIRHSQTFSFDSLNIIDLLFTTERKNRNVRSVSSQREDVIFHKRIVLSQGDHQAVSIRFFDEDNLLHSFDDVDLHGIHNQSFLKRNECT